MKTSTRSKLIALATMAMALALTPACTAVRKSDKGTWTYVNVLNRKSITSIDLGNDGSLKVKGYSSDASEAIKAAAEGMAKGFTESAIPK